MDDREREYAKKIVNAIDRTNRLLAVIADALGAEPTDVEKAISGNVDVPPVEDADAK